MSVDRLKRVNELLHREIGAAMYHVLKEDEVDLSAITVTHVVTSRDLRHARVLVSIREHKDEHEAILSLLRRRRVQFQNYIHRSVVLKYTPRLQFALDGSVEQGDHILDILSKLDIPAALPEDDASDLDMTPTQPDIDQEGR